MVHGHAITASTATQNRHDRLYIRLVQTSQCIQILDRISKTFSFSPVALDPNISHLPVKMINPFVLIPLYAWPSGTIWDGVFASVANYPSVQFQVIINVDNGPGSNIPDPTWISTISKLNSYSNTQLLGYIPIDGTNMAKSEVISDIDTYAAWATHSGDDIHMDGIFFDESPNTDSSSTLPYMQDITGHARSALAINGVNPYVMLNPGAPTSDNLYATADNVVAFEASYAKFTTKNINNIQNSQRSKSSVIIHHFNSDEATQKSVVQSLVDGSIPGIYITDSSTYMRLDSLFPQLVAAIASASLSSSSSSDPTTSATATVIQSPTPTTLATSVVKTSATPTAILSSGITKTVTNGGSNTGGDNDDNDDSNDDDNDDDDGNSSTTTSSPSPKASSTDSSNSRGWSSNRWHRRPQKSRKNN